MAKFVSTQGEWPTPGDVYKLIKVRNTQVAQAMTLVDVKSCIKYVQFGEAERLDREVYTNGEGTVRFGDALPDRKAKATTVVDAHKMLPRYKAAVDRVELAIRKLPPRDAMILSMRLGLGSFEPMTLEEVAERYELTRERIRQIEEKAYETLAQAGITITHDQIMRLQEVLDEIERIVRSV
jgi:RNA polymerase sigma factor (sigma-70 family)